MHAAVYQGKSRTSEQSTWILLGLSSRDGHSTKQEGVVASERMQTQDDPPLRRGCKSECGPGSVSGDCAQLGARWQVCSHSLKEWGSLPAGGGGGGGGGGLTKPAKAIEQRGQAKPALGGRRVYR